MANIVLGAPAGAVPQGVLLMTDKTDEWYLRKGVELADGFRVSTTGAGTPAWHGPDGFMVLVSGLPTTAYIDALAAQLRRQVRKLKQYHLTYSTTGEWIRVSDSTGYPPIKVRTTAKGPDETMNTIKAIVDSGVLNDLPTG